MSRELILFLIVIVGIICVTPNCSVAGSEICVDLYTQYLSPWGGQGPHMASDAFPPDGVVVLKTNVTFQGDGVPDKLVYYTIEAPNGEAYSATDFTQADGIAVFEYLPPSSQDNFGQWTVKADVDLAGTIVSDTLYFLMGWLVEVVEVDALPVAYRSETMSVNVTLTRICMQDPRDIMNMLLKGSSGIPITDNDLLLYVTVTDQLSQFVGTSALDSSMITELGVYDLNEFVGAIGDRWIDHMHVILARYSKLANLISNGIAISPLSFCGKATIHANLITDFPGVPYCPEGLGYIWIRARDLNKNSRANILDISVVAKAYGTEPGDPNWNPMADMDDNGIIDIRDIAKVAKDYGKTV